MNEKIGPFEVKYELGHSYEETWEKTDSFCPVCGIRNVWVQDSDGDYYQGPEFMCASCGASGVQWTGHDGRKGNWQDRQRFDAINQRVMP